jgi:hypothetical protein
MKTITKQYNIYTFEELSQKAKEKALQDYREEDNTPFLEDNLREYIHEELETAGYTPIYTATSQNPAIRPLYSLSYCQGDGLMFESTLEEIKTGNIFTIKHAGHYYHERSTTITGHDKDGNDLPDKTIEDFNNNIYIPICERVAQRGYEEIEYNASEEYFAETCTANDYTFLEDGTMFNA